MNLNNHKSKKLLIDQEKANKRPMELRIITDFRLNPFTMNGVSYPYQKDDPISNFRGIRWYFFIFIQILKESSISKQWKS